MRAGAYTCGGVAALRESMIAVELDYTFRLELVFVAVAGVLLWLRSPGGRRGPTAERPRTEPAPAAR